MINTEEGQVIIEEGTFNKEKELQAFMELGIILEDENDDGLTMYRWNQVQGKLDLVTSITFLTYSKQEVSP